MTTQKKAVNKPVLCLPVCHSYGYTTLGILYSTVTDIPTHGCLRPLCSVIMHWPARQFVQA